MSFESLTTKEWYAVFWKTKYYEPNQICYQTTEKIRDKVLLVKRGNFVVQTLNREGEMISTEILEENSLINLEVLMEKFSKWDLPCFIQYQVIALEDSIIYEIDKEFFLSHLYVNPREYHELFEKVIAQMIKIFFAYTLSNDKTGLKVSWALFRLSTTIGQKSEDGIVEFPRYVTQTFVSQLAQAGLARTNEEIQLLYQKGILASRKQLNLNQDRLLEHLKSQILTEYSDRQL
ncbi:Crp/Fnr family transcriptional regulator [Listeria valentina]|uniref:Crp/Fnr family transcriptional regulator n=1 Tax=Listeria valentina TaxID=2705293 RepID=UPI00142F46B7|nr:Crp/Fnr family transcriptional regulator [Listeria valentina]